MSLELVSPERLGHVSLVQLEFQERFRGSMLVGRGMIASHYEKYRSDERVTVFASGVSNSNERDPEKFEREAEMLRAAINQSSLFVYFSSLFDREKALSPYACHKRDMETLVETNAENFLIFRLPQVVGPNNNSFNLIGYIAEKLLSGGEFNVQTRATRVILDVTDLVTLSEHFISQPDAWNQTVQIAPPPAIPVIEIVEQLEEILQVEGRYVLVDEGEEFEGASDVLTDLAARFGIAFGLGYCSSVLRKYYGAD